MEHVFRVLFNKNYSKNVLHDFTTSDLFITLFILISLALLVTPEFIFARDIYPAHYRANTMFKLGYEAFMMAGIVVSFVVFRFLEKSPFSIKTRTSKLTKFSFWTLTVIQLFLVG